MGFRCFLAAEPRLSGILTRVFYMAYLPTSAATPTAPAANEEWSAEEEVTVEEEAMVEEWPTEEEVTVEAETSTETSESPKASTETPEARAKGRALQARQLDAGTIWQGRIRGDGHLRYIVGSTLIDALGMSKGT